CGGRWGAGETRPPLVRTLKILSGRDRAVAIDPVAVGRDAGTLAFRLTPDNPTVSTASEAFRAAAAGAPGWEGQRWTKRIDVPVTTLDKLVSRHGAVAFIKLDVEGSEADALAGLTLPSATLSFEFTTMQRDVAAACIPPCVQPRYTRYNAVLGESLTFVHQSWVSGEEIAAWVWALPQPANSGDIYARLPEPPA